jgi:hypothetical protein
MVMRKNEECDCGSGDARGKCCYRTGSGPMWTGQHLCECDDPKCKVSVVKSRASRLGETTASAAGDIPKSGRGPVPRHTSAPMRAKAAWKLHR